MHVRNFTLGRHLEGGFILPAVLAMSLAVVAVMAGLLTVTTSSYQVGYTEQYQRMADEAAEAGSAYATACLSLSAHVQTWGSTYSKPDLAPNTDCAGTTITSSSTPTPYYGNGYVYSDSHIRTYFAVGNLDYSLTFSAQISAFGYVDVADSNGNFDGTPEFTSIQKKVITWPTETAGQSSASGTNRTCAVVNYQVYCWGYNAYGQLGDGRYLGSSNGGLEDPSPIDSTVPVKVYQAEGVMSGKKIVKIFAAQYHTCALSNDGKMYCWGYNGYGQLGNNTTTDSAVPVQVGGALAGKTITDIGGTNNDTCAIATGKIYCWGINAKGVTGRNTTSGNTLTPTLVTASNTSTTLPTSYTATKLSTSGSRAQLMCAIVSGAAYCWGDNSVGSVGDSSTGNNRLVPTKVTSTGVLNGKTVTSISQDGYVSDASGGWSHVCVVASGAAYCWGENSYGQLGNNSGSYTDSSSPVAVYTGGVLSGKTIVDVKVGLRHSCVLDSNGQMYCWGLNSNGQVGDNTTSTRIAPVTVYQEAGALTSTNVVSIGAGANRSCAVVTDGRTYCWGLNSTGQIGDGTKNNNRIKPTESLFLRPTGNEYIF